MTNDQLEKLRQLLSDFYKVVYWAEPGRADEFMKKKIEELGGRTCSRPTFVSMMMMGWTTDFVHQDESGIYIMHASHACCILDEDLANKILLLGMPS